MTIIHANLLDWAKAYDGPKFHSLLTDPPYHLTSITDRFGKQGSAPAQYGTDGAYARASRGFMNATWDGLDENGLGIAFQPSTWAALAEHLYPGAWGMAFASSRGWHRLACAIEDAGMIIQPTIFGWSYGSGFPKATNIAAGIDARAFRAWLDLHPEEHDRLKATRALERAARRAGDASAVKDLRTELKALSVAYKAQAGLAGTVVGTKKQTGAKFKLAQELIDNGGYNDRNRETFDVMGAATEAAAHWLGHRYGGQVLKPALEPVIVFQKPYDGSALDCITRTGAGALWIDGARIGATDKAKFPVGTQKTGYNEGFATNGDDCDPNGRWPANLILSHAPTCNGTCAPGCPVAALGAQSGESSSAPHNGSEYRNRAMDFHMTGGTTSHDDSGTAARFFFQADYMAERMELADAIAYVAKASRSEREAGLDPRQTALMRLLDDGDWEDFEDAGSDHSAYGEFQGIPGTKHTPNNRRAFDATTVSDGRATPIDNAYQRGETTRRNTHPTIKPLSLCRYLATLLLPPAQYGPRRLLVPFAGAFSEVIGADLAGWEEIEAIELEADHVAIGNARRAYWKQRRWELDDPARKLTIKASAKVPHGQADMFTEEVA